MGVDERLLNAPTEDRQNLNQAANEASSSSLPDQSDVSNSTDRASEFNQIKAEAQREQLIKEAEEQNKQDEENKKDDSGSPNPINQATSNWLKQAWANIIPSFGLTLIWINIHVFLGTIFGDKLFCKLGAEWLPGEIQRSKFKQAKNLGKVAGTIESGGLAMLDLGCLLIIIAILTIFYLIISIMSFQWEAIKLELKFLWDLLIS